MGGFDLARLDSYLETRTLARDIRYYRSIDSTNSQLERLEGLEEGALVLADYQTQGRGRQGRSWKSFDQAGLYFSLLLRPGERQDLGILPLLAAAGLVKSLEGLGLEPRIKWPNDIYLGSKKLAGILLELVFRGQDLDYVILGMGVNLNISLGQLEGQGLKSASSLREELGWDLDREKFLARLLKELELLYNSYKDQDDLEEVLRINRERSLILNKRVRIVRENSEVAARVLDITKEGKLVVEYDNKEVGRIFCGEVSIRGVP